MFMVLSSWQSHCESSPGSFDECRTAPSGRRPNTKPDDLGCEFACTGCQSLHPPSPFIIITQPESWYSFYHPTEGRRLSRHGQYLGGIWYKWNRKSNSIRMEISFAGSPISSGEGTAAGATAKLVGRCTSWRTSCGTARRCWSVLWTSARRRTASE